MLTVLLSMASRYASDQLPPSALCTATFRPVGLPPNARQNRAIWMAGSRNRNSRKGGLRESLVRFFHVSAAVDREKRVLDALVLFDS